jgi:hypothetical protein
MNTSASIFSWSVWVRRGRGRWRCYGRAGTEADAERLALRVPRGLDKLLRCGCADPNEDDPWPSPTHPPPGV